MLIVRIPRDGRLRSMRWDRRIRPGNRASTTWIGVRLLVVVLAVQVRPLRLIPAAGLGCKRMSGAGGGGVLGIITSVNRVLHNTRILIRVRLRGRRGRGSISCYDGPLPLLLTIACTIRTAAAVTRRLLGSWSTLNTRLAKY